nr:esterase 2 [Geocoris pallidipennis]
MPLGHLLLPALALLAAVVGLAAAEPATTVSVEVPGLGRLRGTTNTTLWTRRTLYQFMGIPYAKPPSGPRRFKPAEAAERWEGELDATRFRRACPQSSSSDEIFKLVELHGKEDLEDCLHLNVYTNQEVGSCSSGGDLLPVMVYLHGGSFRVGSATSFRPNYLLDRDIVLVVPQYRLGPLGFLSFQNEDVSGNMGLLDMVLALEWVQRHISGFCGDPNQVTIFGQSSGGAAVSLLMASPLTQDRRLFQRAIVQSGSALCDWAIELQPEVTARGVAASANCTGTDLEMAACLRALPVHQVLVAHLNYIRGVLVEERMAVNGRMGGNHAVVQRAGSPKFLTQNPKTIFQSGEFLDIPTMVGVTKHEGSFFVGNIYDFLEEIDIYMNNSDYLINKMVNTTLQFSGIIDTTGALTDVFTDRFFTRDQLGNFTAMTPGLVDLCGLTLLKSCTLAVARAQYPRAPTYLYSFNYLGHLTKFGYGEEVDYPFPGGVAHSDDLVYLFPMDSGNLTEDEMVIADIMVKLWTNFATTGDPNPIQEVRWERMSHRFGPYLRIDTHTTLREDFGAEFTVTMDEGLGKFPPTVVPSSASLITFLIALTAAALSALAIAI